MKKDIPPYFKEKFFTQDVSDFSKYKYLKIIHDEEFIKGPGSGDQKFQLAQYIKLAYKLKLKLELPQRLLAPQHQTVSTLARGNCGTAAGERTRILGKELAAASMPRRCSLATVSCCGDATSATSAAGSRAICTHRPRAPRRPR